ncbi:MAG: tRNA methyl transferase PRC-barrel domain-containing protein, partial [Patescibacteria group bacterium]
TRSLFPIGDYLKSEERKIAADAGILTAAKKESQGLCFVGDIDFQKFLRSYLPKREGAIVRSDGEVIGTHEGAHFFTPGQRHGIKVGGGTAYYVAEKNVEENKIVVASLDDPVLYKKENEVSGLNLLFDLPELVEVRIRYRQPRQSARIIKHEACSINHKAGFKFLDSCCMIQFDTPQRGVAPGQSAVFYCGEEMLGGGIIQ